MIATVLFCFLVPDLPVQEQVDRKRQERMESLLTQLQSGKLEEQRSALYQLGYFGNRRALPAIRAAVAKPELRAAAIGALTLLGDVDSAPAILKALAHVPAKRDPDNDIANSVHNAVYDLGLTGNAEHVFPALNSVDPVVKGYAISILGLLGDPSAVPRLLQLLDDPEVKVRRSAASALGHIGDKRALPGLKKALKDNDGDVCFSAAEALLRLGDQSAKNIYLHRSESLFSVVEVLGKEAVPDLVKLLQHDEQIRSQALWALADIGDRRIVPSLLEAFNKAKPQRKVSSRNDLARVLYRLGHREIVDRLIVETTDKNEDARLDAAQALGHLPYDHGKIDGTKKPIFHQQEAVAALTTLLVDPSFNVRRTALTALGEIGDASALPSVLKTTAGEPALAVDAVGALDGFRHRDADRALVRLLDDPREEVRQEIAQEFQRRITFAVVPYLIEMLEDEDPDVRRHAGDALMPLTFTEQADVASWKKWWETNKNTSISLLAAEELRWRGHPIPPVHQTQSIPPLLRLLRDPSPVTAFLARRALYDLTGNHVSEFGLDFHAPKKHRDTIAKGWEQWRQQHKDTFTLSPRQETLPLFQPRSERQKQDKK